MTPETSSAPAVGRKTTVSVFIGSVLVVGALNYFLFRSFSPAFHPRGVVVAAFRADFRPDKPKEGWRYLWNAKGPIGHATNYAELRWNGTLYAADDTLPFPNPPPARYLRVTEGGGHPGHDPAQGPDLHESSVIAAFTVPNGGRYWLTNGFIARPSGARRGSIHVQVFVNDVKMGQSIYCSDRDGISFDRELGPLSAGDTIYVVIGPNEVDFEDGFDLDFAIVL